MFVCDACEPSMTFKIFQIHLYTAPLLLLFLYIAPLLLFFRDTLTGFPKNQIYIFLCIGDHLDGIQIQKMSKKCLSAMRVSLQCHLKNFTRICTQRLYYYYLCTQRLYYYSFKSYLTFFSRFNQLKKFFVGMKFDVLSIKQLIHTKNPKSRSV